MARFPAKGILGILDITEIAKTLSSYAQSPQAQVKQIDFRAKLAESWEIPVGASVLEVGCGQGDTTAVLAEVVGPSGQIVAVDVAPPEYGAPISIGESMARLQRSPRGGIIEVHFNCDLEVPNWRFEELSFDYVVLAHSTWYFESKEKLYSLLRRLSRWGKKLALSDWNYFPVRLEEVPHFIAVVELCRLSGLGLQPGSNIRTPYHQASLIRDLPMLGWKMEHVTNLDSSELDDGRWEVEACIAAAPLIENADELPRAVRDSMLTQIDLLRQYRATMDIPSLSSFALVASSAATSGDFEAQLD